MVPEVAQTTRWLVTCASRPQACLPARSLLEQDRQRGWIWGKGEGGRGRGRLRAGEASQQARRFRSRPQGKAEGQHRAGQQWGPRGWRTGRWRAEGAWVEPQEAPCSSLEHLQPAPRGEQRRLRSRRPAACPERQGHAYPGEGIFRGKSKKQE